MYHYGTKDTLIFNELSPDLAKDQFDFKQKKVIANIDSLYLSIKLKKIYNADGLDENFEHMIKLLEKEKVNARQDDVYMPFAQEHNRFMFDVGTKYLMYGVGFSIYDFDLHKPDKYSFFITGHPLNENTPEAVVQIRSEFLWLYGVNKVLEEVYNDVKSFFSEFDIKIDKIIENRIDYAYHTNYIQNPTTYFTQNKLSKMQQSRFERWTYQGAFTVDGQTDLDYFTLGSRKANNLFFRVYNKTKEVLEQGYKQFFYEIWLQNGLISKYDKYCYEIAFAQPHRFSYKYLDVARLIYYKNHGQDNAIKLQIDNMINSNDINHVAVKKLADKLVPKLTIILNVELETKRKYYRTFDKAVNAVLVCKSKVDNCLVDLYKKIDNLQLFANHLTCNNDKNKGIIRFVSPKKNVNYKNKCDVPTSDFWQRIQRCKINGVKHVDQVELVRSYSENLNAKLILKRVSNGITMLSLYDKSVGDIEDKDLLRSGLEQDALDYMAYLTENDLQAAIDYKAKKLPVVRNKITEQSLTLQTTKRALKLIDSTTGQIKADTN